MELKEFLEKLTKLSIESGIYIGGCGCCGSPFLYKEAITKKGYEYEDIIETDLCFYKNGYDVSKGE